MPDAKKKRRLQRKLKLFKALKKLPLEDQQTIIDALSGDACNVLCEGVKNIYIKNHKHIKAQGRKKLQHELSPSRTIIEKLLRAKSKLSKRKKLKQLGRGFPMILGALIPLITEVIKNL